jgi:hypothetical protein
MTRTCALRAFALTLAAATAAQAAVDGSLVPEFAVTDKLDAETRAADLGSAPIEERARRSADALTRAERLRNLPPDQVQAWVAGTLTEAELLPPRTAALPADTADGAAQVQAEPKPGTRRLFRLLIVGGFCVIMAVAMRRQRRQATEASGQRSEVRVCKR